jgi:dimethylargininase
MFKQAIVPTPCPEMVDGLTSADLGKPDYESALVQHGNYVNALRQCGLKVHILDPDPTYPDSTFVEDVALCTTSVAILTNPGAPTRKGETEEMGGILPGYFRNVESIVAPGTLEAGDVMMVGKHFYIGISERTNREGARQLIDLLHRYGMDGEGIPLKDMLHLKSGLSYLENNVLLVAGEFWDMPQFRSFERIHVDPEEAYAANSLWVNGTVLVPEGYQRTLEKIREKGYPTITLDMSEFHKLDGGLSCLSLRF